MNKRVEIKSGDVLGHLTVISETEPRIDTRNCHRKRFVCVCSCGNIVIRNIGNLRRDFDHCCGKCHRNRISQNNRIKHKKHGLIKHPLYSIWAGMRSRCYNKSAANYHNYGGRGITICDKWLNNFIDFYKWSIKYGWEKGLTIDRINNDGNYDPLNCRWTDNITQCNNKRTNIRHEYNGEYLTIPEIVRKYNINQRMENIYLRMFKWDMSVYEAIYGNSHRRNY